MDQFIDQLTPSLPGNYTDEHGFWHPTADTQTLASGQLPLTVMSQYPLPSVVGPASSKVQQGHTTGAGRED